MPLWLSLDKSKCKNDLQKATDVLLQREIKPLGYPYLQDCCTELWSSNTLLLLLFIGGALCHSLLWLEQEQTVVILQY